MKKLRRGFFKSWGKMIALIFAIAGIMAGCSKKDPNPQPLYGVIDTTDTQPEYGVIPLYGTMLDTLN